MSNAYPTATGVDEMAQITDLSEIRGRLRAMAPADLVTALQSATYQTNVLPNSHPDVEAYRVWMVQARELIISELWRAA